MNRKHGWYGTPTYKSFTAMHGRCTGRLSNPRYYRDKGITVCERWRDFRNFLADMGARPAETTLDRIDNNKGYSPDNCRWATVREQQQNKSNSVRLPHNGKTQCIAEWARELGIRPATIQRRLSVYRWPIADVLNPDLYFRTSRPISRKPHTLLTHNGVTQSAVAWSEATGLDYKVIWARLKDGWSVADTLTRPMRITSHSKTRAALKKAAKAPAIAEATARLAARDTQ